MSVNFSHQLRIFDPDCARPVVLIGAGSVGSHIAYLLAKAGVSDITVYDHDTVASHNVPMSLYRCDDLGRYKVEALKEIIRSLTGVEIRAQPDRYVLQPLKRCSVIMSVDDMDSGRIPIWEKVRGSPSIDVMLDTRVKRCYGEIYTIKPCSTDDVENYTKTLFSNSEVPPRLCGTHGFVPVSCALASNTVSSLCHFWMTGVYVWQRAFRYDTLEQVY